MTDAVLTINSKNYGAWSLRGWLLCRLAGLAFDELALPTDDPSTRAELLLASPSFLVPRLEHRGIAIWGTLAIGEHLDEAFPDAGLLPTERLARAHCRSICGEMHSGFVALRSALPMHVNARYDNFVVWAGAQADIDRITAIWRECLDVYGGPYLFGARATMADAMFAPVCLRFVTYDVALDEPCRDYVALMLDRPDLREWIAGAEAEPDDVEELEVEF